MKEKQNEFEKALHEYPILATKPAFWFGKSLTELIRKCHNKRKVKHK